MHFDGNFRDWGHVNVASVAALLPTDDDAVWESENRHILYGEHVDTRTIMVNNLPLSWDGSGYAPERMLFSELGDQCMQIATALADKVNRRAGRVMLIRLPAGKKIPKHSDGGYYLMHCNRVHVPLETNENVEFFVGEETRNLKVGVCTEVNNAKIHGVQNNGTTRRIHLICDLV